MGQIYYSMDCKFIYTCSKPNTVVNIEMRNCSIYSQCVPDDYGDASCVCQDGYIGNGVYCQKSIKIKINIINLIFY